MAPRQRSCRDVGRETVSICGLVSRYGAKIQPALWGAKRGLKMFEPASVALVVLLWALAILALVAVAVCWPKLAGRGLLVLVGRIGTQVMASALVVLAVAATLNQQNGWYGNWADLGRDFAGSAPSVKNEATRGQLQTARNYDGKAAVAADQRARQLFGARRSAFAHGANIKSGLSPHGQYLKVTVPGLGPAAGAAAGKVLIWLPPSYGTGAADSTYPVIQAYGGVPGGPEDYSKRLRVHDVIARTHRGDGLIEPIVVIPDFTPAGLDTECTDSPGVAMETWLNETVPQWVLKNLRARPDKESWAVMGFSAGGFCAQVSAVHHSDRFGAAMLFGAYNRPHWGNWLPYGSIGTWPSRYNLESVVRRNPPPIDVWIEVSEGDRFSAPPSERLIKATRAPMSITSVYLPQAGHRIEVWKGVMPRALGWLARTEPGFREPSAKQALALTQPGKSWSAGADE